MQILKIDTDSKAGVKDIEGDLKSLQNEVGGLLTIVPYYEELQEQGIDIFADDEGLLKANPKVSLFVTDKKHRTKILTSLVGNLIFVSHDNECNTIGLTQEQINFITEHLKEMFYFKPNGKMGMAHTFWF